MNEGFIRIFIVLSIIGYYLTIRYIFYWFVIGGPDGSRLDKSTVIFSYAICIPIFVFIAALILVPSVFIYNGFRNK